GMKMKRLLAVLLAAILILSAAGCAGAPGTDSGSTGDEGAQESTPSEPVTIRVGDLASYEIVKDADEKGFFKEEFEKDNVTIEIKSFQSGPPEVEALAAKDLDFALMGDMPSVTGVAAGTGIQIISGLLDGTHGNGLIAREDAGINTIPDLKGKKVGVPVGTTAHQLLIKMLEKNGLTSDDIELVNLGAGDIVTSLQSDNIQAAVTFDPGLSKAVAGGGIKKISDAEGYKLIINVIVGRTEFTEKYPDLTVRFLKVLQKTVEWRNANFEESLEITANRIGVNKEDIRAALTSMPPVLALDDEKKQAILETAKYLKDNNLITKELTVDELFNDTYAKEAGIL
ncbi:MAG TPA: NrtA/SsuA/CpmA family ABC transporter substrate-binding protein, partial [Anaerovoracaceae bacterium]|nr:NrtA/SsuA/CpmA family ABC transporter substrate-binding protein [Anaerovoracaceae bacterium]